MYIKLKNGNIEKYPYSIIDLKKDNPKTSFPANISSEMLVQFGIYNVNKVAKPSITYKQNIEEGTPKLIDGQWTQVWNVTDKPQDEIDEITTSLRAEAYRNESDSLFFKAQRGESTQEEWLNKINEIKQRYPNEA
jgi:hypothetical protein